MNKIQIQILNDIKKNIIDEAEVATNAARQQMLARYQMEFRIITTVNHWTSFLVDNKCMFRGIEIPYVESYALSLNATKHSIAKDEMCVYVYFNDTELALAFKLYF